MAKQKNVYFFGDGAAEGDGTMRAVLGGKGVGLAEMTNLGIPVPPGFTISTDVCAAYYANKEKYPEGLEDDVLKNLKRLEKTIGKKLGDANDPLLVSVRSGAAISMPGMMDTILNLGINDKAVYGLAEKTGNPRFAWDAYRRFIQMYGDVVMLVPGKEFEEAITSLKKAKGVQLDTGLSAGDLEELVTAYKKIVRKSTGKDFPQEPMDQLWGAINAVFGSWMNERAIAYRKYNGIKEGELKGTAVNVQSMVFGNFGDDSGTGVCFSRDPSTGERVFYGEYLMNAQGEDVVAGVRTPEKIATLEKKNKAIYDELVKIKNRLEKHFRDMQDMEFTVQQGKLFLLQTRNGKRTGAAAVKCAIDMVSEGLINRTTAITRVTPELLDQILHPMIDQKALKTVKSLTKGLNASPGAAAGQIVFSAKEAEEWTAQKKKVLLVRKETSPEDITGMVVSQGILTSTGGMTSHAAVVARGMGTPCVVGAQGVTVQGEKVDIGGKTYKKGDWITIDGSTGDVYDGALPLVKPTITDNMQTFLSWCDDVRAKSVRGNVKGFDVRANADQPDDAKRAFAFGAQGVGLCRTEHMFFDADKLVHFRAMIVADTEDERKAALKKILPLQQRDFIGIFKAMEGKPVIIRLLDPPLHEFVPHTDSEIAALAKQLSTSTKTLLLKIDRLHEANPMLGHRGCRLAVTYPEIYDMQVEAIARAAADCVKKGIPVKPEIMIPIVGDERELALIRPRSEAIVKRVLESAGVKLHIDIGTMIEVPRAALLADKIAAHADFFSFGTNDLTQMTFAFSRDDIGSFLPSYLDKKVLDVDPFQTIDEDGVGQLIKGAVEKGRSVEPNMTIGICGEHGGDPATIDFCYRTGLSYVSCSPFRVPLARLAGAQAVIRNASDSAAASKSAATGHRGHPAKAEATDASKQRGRPVRVQAVKPAVSVSTDTADAPATPKRRDRVARSQVVESVVSASTETPDAPATPKRRGRPAQVQVVESPVSASTKTPDAPATPKRRGRPAQTQVVESPVSASTETPDAPATPKRRGRPVQAQVVEPAVSASIDTPEAPAIPKRHGRVARAQVVESAVSASTETPDAPATPKRRGRPARAQVAESVVSASAETPDAPATPKRRGRPARAQVAESVVSASAETPDAATTPKRRGRPARAQVVESAASSVSADTADTPAAPKRRGRPAKAKPETASLAPAEKPTVETSAKPRGRPARVKTAESSDTADTSPEPVIRKQRGRAPRISKTE